VRKTAAVVQRSRFFCKVGRFIKAGRGKAHFDACRDALYTVTPSAGNPDFENLCTFIRNRIRKRALLVVLTSLDDPVLAESLERSIQLISRQHLVVVNMMTPSGAGPLFDDRPLASEDEIYQRLAGHEIWYRLAELKKVFSRYGVRMEQLEQSAMSLTLLNQYMTIKQKQIL
jgi:uncharacterized protein (DUF58 family)